MYEPNSIHYQQVARKIDQGLVTPFLGAGVNLCDRQGDWKRGQDLPSGNDLAVALAVESAYPRADREKLDLSRVSQFVTASLGPQELYGQLRSLFNATYQPSSVHRFLARIPARLRALREATEREEVATAREIPYQLILTTNYDFALETAFDELGEPYDVLWYAAKESDGVPRGKFWHRPPGADAEPVPIKDPSAHEGLSLAERTIILKLHGAVDPKEPNRDSFVISEDDYIAYLSVGDISDAIPMEVRAQMTKTHFLFLGYSLSDWNLRVILSRIWGTQTLSRNSWAVQLRPTDDDDAAIEALLWQKRPDNIMPLYAPLTDYVGELERTLAGTPVAV